MTPIKRVYADQISENLPNPRHRRSMPLLNDFSPITIQNMATAIICSEDFLLHDTGEHPERKARYSVIADTLRADRELMDELDIINPAPATDENILRCHTKQTLDRIASASPQSESAKNLLDADTVICRDSDYVARLAAGAACLAAENVIEGKNENALVLCRPPGHHATIDRSMGFCLYNNVAIAARHVQQKYNHIHKILIVDWDVHHGNGTQDIFYNDPSVFYLSLHQYPWYPGTGAANEIGSNEGEGYNLNIPILPSTSAEDYRLKFEQALEMVAKNFNPDLIMISAGFDAHLYDPLGQLRLEDDDFAAMTLRLKEWAKNSCEGRLVSCLEGGYNLQTLGNTVKSHVNALRNE